MTPVLIGLHGVKRSGKDTTAGFIEKWASRLPIRMTVKRRGFADKVKLAFARQFFPEITQEQAINWCDIYKESDESLLVPDYKEWDNFKEVTFREAMRQFSTEGARDVYGDDFWVDQLLPTGTTLGMAQRGYPNINWQNNFLIERFACADICLITDERFANENRRINQLGGINIKIKRKDAEQAVIDEAARQGKEVHRSELGLPDEMFDYVIDNSDNDMGRAYQRTVNVLEHIGLLS